MKILKIIKTNSKKCTAFCLAAAMALSMAGCSGAGGSGKNADKAYYPALTITGDVNAELRINATSDDSIFVEIYESHDAESSEDGTAGGSCTQGLVPEKFEFEFEGETHKGYLLSDLLEQADLPTYEAQVYFEGYDGMMSSISAADLEKNYILFGENGWEAMNPDYPPSCNVKEIESIIIAADEPSDVPAAVTAANEKGEEVTISPGTALAGDYSMTREFQGESEKGGKSVRVYLSDKKVTIGGSTYIIDGNRILPEEAQDR